ncbi:hypothetical protein ACFU6K_05340 [Kitasatospora sp. NPDC057512]|uniref:hypothetical protein n=1 Tax=Kitasatospora sp. NPDC057512 TaxID=3346154 RepID=UPI00369ADE8B
MRKNNRVLNQARRLAPAVALTAALVAGGAATAAPAFAATGSHPVSGIGVFGNVAPSEGSPTASGAAGGVSGVGIFGNVAPGKEPPTANGAAGGVSGVGIFGNDIEPSEGSHTANR